MDYDVGDIVYWEDGVNETNGVGEIMDIQYRNVRISNSSSIINPYSWRNDHIIPIKSKLMQVLYGVK